MNVLFSTLPVLLVRLAGAHVVPRGAYGCCLQQQKTNSCKGLSGTCCSGLLAFSVWPGVVALLCMRPVLLLTRGETDAAQYNCRLLRGAQFSMALAHLLQHFEHGLSPCFDLPCCMLQWSADGLLTT